MKRIISFMLMLILLSSVLFAQGELDKMPQIKGGIIELAKNIKYPEAAKKEGKMGTVFLKAIIDENGNVESVNIEKGVDSDLDAAAVKAVKITKFIPGIKDGKNVQAEVTIPIKFKLNDKKQKS
jgi:TonB family protein